MSETTGAEASATLAAAFGLMLHVRVPPVPTVRMEANAPVRGMKQRKKQQRKITEGRCMNSCIYSVTSSYQSVIISDHVATKLSCKASNASKLVESSQSFRRRIVQIADVRRYARSNGAHCCDSPNSWLSHDTTSTSSCLIITLLFALPAYLPAPKLLALPIPDASSCICPSHTHKPRAHPPGIAVVYI